MDEQTSGVVAATLWDLRAQCEAQLRLVAKLQDSLANGNADGCTSQAATHAQFDAALMRIRHLALEMAGRADRCRRRLARTRTPSSR